ncbi:hypothetical protein [Halobellus captivus]|uniref:hypothetical protein n=1 Tax=Halobellus captivus TaxID=2592614 RepID=UPI0011A060C1|nr:hypothetical protein [Halobellus captivus]
MSVPHEDGGKRPSESRRRFLTYAALAVLGGSGIAGAWAATRSDETPDPASTPTAVPTEGDDPSADSDEPDAVPELVRRYAPDLYFGDLEKWFPTDPRQYVVETEGEPVVDGFTALAEYSSAFAETGAPPDPTVFYNVVEAVDGVDVVQYWCYSVFDQFTVNFHWHDWELLQVFVDRETDAPILLSASAHARGSPNNEFLDPDLSGGRRIGILSEVGSHSSASEVNGVIPSFERLSTGEWESDVTNDILDVTQNLAAPFAYGLPRDEGARLPFAMPELDGYRLDQHPALSVDRADFIDERVTVEDWHGIPRPPMGLPLREPGLVLTHSESSTASDGDYRLAPLTAVRDAVSDFVGPQLSFEFAIPGFVEEQFADHITSVGIPWEQDRYGNPLDDVTDPAHRRRIDGSAPSGLSNRVVGRVRYLATGSDGALDRVSDEARDALDGLIDVSLHALPIEAAVRLASESPEATVTRGGVFGYLHVEPGAHQLVVNAPGFAPLGYRFVHEGGLVRTGTNGELTLVTNEDAGWIRGDGRDANGVSRVRVIEAYAGVVFDGQPVESDRFAVAVHRGGRYTVEIVDRNGTRGAYRVGPDDFDDDFEVVREDVETGKRSIASVLRDELADLHELAATVREDVGDDDPVLDRLSRAREEAESAVRIAERDGSDAANERLSNVISLLQEALELLSGDRQRAYSDSAVAAIDPRLTAAIDRARTAMETEVS